MLDLFQFLGNVETLIGGAGAIVFTVSYGAFFSWRKTEAGRSLFYVFCAIDALFINNALASFLGIDYPGRDIVRFIILTAVTLTMWRLVFVLWRNWAKGDPRPLNIEPKTRPLAPNRKKEDQ